MRDAAGDSDRVAGVTSKPSVKLIHAIAKVADDEHALNFIVMIDSQIAEKLDRSRSKIPRRRDSHGRDRGAGTAGRGHQARRPGRSTGKARQPL